MTHLIWTSNTLLANNSITVWPDLNRLRSLRAVVKCGATFVNLPPNLENVRICSDSNLTIVLPDSLLVLNVSNCVVKGLENHPNLTTLIYRHQHVVEPFFMPPNLTMLKLPPTHQLAEFPQSLRVLLFHQYYNFSVKVLPSTLQKWDCGFSWNHPLPDLPLTMTKLSFGPFLKQKLTTLPNNIKSLILNHSTMLDFFDLLRLHNYPQLTQLRIRADVRLSPENVNSIKTQLPALQLLACREFSESLTELDKICKLSLFDVRLKHSMDFTQLSNLRKLAVFLTVTLDEECDFVLPPLLETFRVTNCDAATSGFWVKLHLNPNLKTLYIASTFPTFLIATFPDKLKSLEINGNAICNLPLPLPRTLRSLRISNNEDFNQDLGVLPPNLEILNA